MANRISILSILLSHTLALDAVTWVDPEQDLSVIVSLFGIFYDATIIPYSHSPPFLYVTIITALIESMRQLVLTICLVLSATRLSQAVDFVGKSGPPHTDPHAEFIVETTVIPMS